MADSFNTKTWETEETITASDLNRMEQGIKSANDRVIVVSVEDENEFTYNKLLSYIADHKIVILYDQEYHESSDLAHHSTLKGVMYDYRKQRYFAFFDTIQFDYDNPDSSFISIVTYAASSPDSLMLDY